MIGSGNVSGETCLFLDPYWMLTRDENEQVAEVLGRMYETDVIGQKHTRDLGLEDEADNRPDPRTKMQLRHQQVHISFNK